MRRLMVSVLPDIDAEMRGCDDMALREPVPPMTVTCDVRSHARLDTLVGAAVSGGALAVPARMFTVIAVVEPRLSVTITDVPAGTVAK